MIAIGTNKNIVPEPQPFRVSELDTVISLQLCVAWAGERGEEKRLGWWRTDMVSEFGGEAFFKRLLPATWRFAALESVREAARIIDTERRTEQRDPDALVTLFNFGFEIDEHLSERFREHKRAGREPAAVFPTFGKLIAGGWSKDQFAAFAASQGSAKHEVTPSGRLIKGSRPDSIDKMAGELVAALLPLSDRYPLPYFRRNG